MICGKCFKKIDYRINGSGWCEECLRNHFDYWGCGQLELIKKQVPIILPEKTKIRHKDKPIKIYKYEKKIYKPKKQYKPKKFIPTVNYYQSMYTSWELSAFRQHVIERDFYCCYCCGKYHRSNHVHHHNCKKDFPEQVIDIDNGITLCYKCHMELHNKINGSTKEKSELFIENRKQELLEPLLELLIKSNLAGEV